MNYFFDQGLTQTVRKTSTVWDDRGDGACETFHVSEAIIQQKSQPIMSFVVNIAQSLFPWLLLGWIGLFIFEIQLTARQHTRQR